MDVNEKRKLLQELLDETENVRINKPSELDAEDRICTDESDQLYFHINRALEDMGDIKYNYQDYLIYGLNCDKELTRIPTANYELCTAILTMLLREERFCFGSFEPRVENGDVKLVLKRMLEVLAQ